ncbi:transcription elongation factor GreA [Patescibacteria group bacterium]|nr:transcription elongation factor GreA [Patescibacteria group bacterium]MBU1448256.1 transcription elongation factor GreA [Patescibacteria group bacterium]MBU2613573.1 transcription elongation factor GreA [Patescibacteria group bacterium]
MVDKIQYVSQEGLDKLKAEHQELKSVRRKEAVVKIETAKALGDLSENADYHEAKNELAFIDGRIQEIEGILKNVSIIEGGGGSSTSVHIGSTIEVESRGTHKSYRIVGSNEADPTQGLISNESPLGAAFLGHAVGDDVEVSTPAGTQTYRIVSVS